MSWHLWPQYVIVIWLGLQFIYLTAVSIVLGKVSTSVNEQFWELFWRAFVYVLFCFILWAGGFWAPLFQ